MPPPLPEPPAVPDNAPVDPLALLARGDRKGAITALMDQHGSTVFNFCSRFLVDRALAEDVLQQVFLNAYRDIHRFEGRSSPRTWLLRIAVHRCQDAIKARNRQRVDADPDAIHDAVDPGRIPDEHVEKSRLVRALEECLEALPRDVRATVLLRFHSGFSYREMAGSLDASAEALQARVSRALPALRRCLEDKGWANV
ncbi:MAG TPA: RNA polymerase sigma factor [Kofleriaceae bacterium]|nr:RNA polymerase sigma factor [Kofleriaceae bacterium]